MYMYMYMYLSLCSVSVMLIYYARAFLIETIAQASAVTHAYHRNELIFPDLYQIIERF